MGGGGGGGGGDKGEVTGYPISHRAPPSIQDV